MVDIPQLKQRKVKNHPGLTKRLAAIEISVQNVMNMVPDVINDNVKSALDTAARLHGSTADFSCYEFLMYRNHADAKIQMWEVLKKFVKIIPVDTLTKTINYMAVANGNSHNYIIQQSAVNENLGYVHVVLIVKIKRNEKTLIERILREERDVVKIMYIRITVAF